MLQRLWERLGRRGTFLLFLTLLDLIYGWSLLSTPATLIKLDLFFSYTTWGWVWIVTGMALALGAWVRRDRVFFALAAMMKAAWASAWVLVWVRQPEVPRAWTSVVIWAAFAGLIMVVSGWPEVMMLKPRGDADD